MSENHSTIHQNFWDAAKAQREIIAIKMLYIKKEERYQSTT